MVNLGKGSSLKVVGMSLKVILGSLLAMSSSPVTMAQQVFTQLNCRIVIEREDQTVMATSIIEASKPTRADYTLRILKIDAAGSGTSEQSGSLSLQPGEPAATSRTTHHLAPTGWIEFHLRVTERLTGTSCEAKEVVSPM